MPTGEQIDAIVIGAGVVGLAVGKELARQGLETIVLERHPNIGEECSSRNSGVIHAGIYYPSGGLKAHLYVRASHCFMSTVPLGGSPTRAAASS